MTAQSQLETYLAAFRRRLEALVVARGAAILTALALALTLLAVYFGTRRAFDAEFMVGARLVLLIGLVAVAVGLLAIPLRRLRKRRGVDDIEHRAPAFDGRIETYDGLAQAPAEKRSPFLGLLAEDTLNLAKRLPVKLGVPSREISIPAVVAVLAAGALVWFAAFGPDNWRYGVRDLWAGWLLDNTLPPQRIAVEPGDGAVRRGGDLTVDALAEGFDPVTMQVFALFDADGNWQSADMSRTGGDGFEFTFFALREPLRYYVTAAGIRSPEYEIDVVDLPEIEQIKLTYDYPEWTGLEPRVEDPGNDIRAVAGTRVTVEVRTDRALAAPELVANGERVAMSANGNISTGSLEVSDEGEYHVSTLFNDDAIQVSDDYFISVVPDKEPVVTVGRPGRDWRASNIEEVTVGIEAQDDFGLDSVELRYAINGGEWQTAALEVAGNQAGGEEVLYLEDMRLPVTMPRARRTPGSRDRGFPVTLEDLRALRRGSQSADDTEPAEEAAAPPAPAERTLEPGDLISYYAVASDRGQTVQTDLFFIEVQPFDRSFTQASAGGGGGGGGGQQQDEISRRQKEILVATWNLIRERDEEQASFLDEQQLNDNAAMLAELQRTLADQAETLASRTRARQLNSVDERIQTFVENLELAAEAMGPAAERLVDVELEEAVPSEQEALQYLLRAEAVFTDIQVSFQQNGGGGGGLAGRDLSELFELEMDLEKNQYETESPVAFDQESSQQEVDEAIAKLQELARRQENLARQAGRRNDLTEQERWRQEELRRETEELKRQLEQLQQRMAEQQAQQQGQQGQEGQQGQPGQPGQPGEPGQQSANAQGGADQQRTAETIEQLNEALQAMNRAGGNQDLDPEQARRAIEQARRQLQRALEGMTAQRQAEAGEAYSDLADRSSELYADQRQVASELQRALENAVDERIDRSGRGGIDRAEARALAERKFALREALEALERDIQQTAQRFRNQTPGASDELNDALADLQQSQAIARLGYAAEGIQRGAANQVAATDAITTSALRDLERSTERALALATREAVEGEQQAPNPNAELVAEIQSLRRQLAELTQGQPGQPGGGSQQQGEPGQPGSAQQNGQPQPGGQQQGGFANTGNRFGGGIRGGFYDPNRNGVWDPLDSGIWRDAEAVDRVRQQLNDAGSDLISLGARLRAEGLSDEELRAVRELGDALRAGLRGNPELVEREYQNLVNLAEQVELSLKSGGDASETAVRTEAPTQVAQGFEESVAEYYRRLSRNDAAE